MPLPKLSVTGLDNENQRRRLPETINGILTHQFDDSRVQTDSEKIAGVTPVNPAFPPGDVRRYGAVGDGVTDDYYPFSQAFLVSGAHETIVPFTSPGYLIGTSLNAPSNFSMRGVGKPLLFTNTNGQDIIHAVDTGVFRISGVRFRGASSSASPSSGYGSYASTSTGIVTCVRVSDVIVDDCEVNQFYSGFAFLNCSRLWVERNLITNWLVYGILASESSIFDIDYNRCIGCTQSGAADAYGIMATGDDVNGRPVIRGSISFNVISDIPSWDGIMSHSCDGLRIIGNDIRNVRSGIDISAPTANQIIKNVIISDNFVQSTTTDTWSAAAGAHVPIKVFGHSSSHAIGVTIANNIVRGFYNTSGMVSSGDTSNIVVEYCERATITGNKVIESGSVISNAGVLAVGDCPGLVIADNTLQGTMAAGGVRLAGVVADTATITGNAIKQTTTTDIGVYITGSTITSVTRIGNSTNCNAGSEFLSTTSTLGIDATDYYSGSATYDPPNLADGAGATTTVTVSGAVLGDFAACSFSLDLQGITVTPYVSAANTVSVRFQNESGGALDLASGTLRARVWPAVA